MDDPKSKEDLLYSLRKGNVQQVNVSEDGQNTKYFLAANPQFKTIDLFNDQMKKIKREVLLQPESKINNRIKNSEQQKEGAPAKKQSRKAKVHI